MNRTTTEAPTFSRRATGWLTLIAAVSLVVAASLIIFSGELSSFRSGAADGFSRSAIGHRAFIELLDELGYRVVQSRHHSGEKARDPSVLVMLEPRVPSAAGPEAELFQDARWLAKRSVLVLPKRHGVIDPTDPERVLAAALLPEDVVDSLLIQVLPDAELVRARSETLVWSRNRYGLVPSIDDVQLVRSENIEPIVVCDRGVLVGLVKESLSDADAGWDEPPWYTILVSDPDLIATHGLARGDNALIAIRAIDELLEPGGTLVVDETLHGFGAAPNVLRALFEFPLVLVVLQTTFLLAGVLTTAFLRFGPPRRRQVGHRRGTRLLVEDTAELLTLGNHDAHTLERYYRMTLTEIVERHHLPSGLDEKERAEWLERRCRARGTTRRPEELQRLVGAAASATSARRPSVVMAAAREIHEWRKEMLNGA